VVQSTGVPTGRPFKHSGALLTATLTPTPRAAPPLPVTGSRRALWVVIALTVIAAALRLYRLRFGYAHGVVGYDDGVYLGSALELVDGRLPYRDFVLVHPPGITVLLLPLAGLGKVIGTAQAMGLAKVATGLAGAAAVPVMARIVWHRGLLAVVIAAGVVAVHDDAVAAAYGLLLEPWLVLCCLLAVMLTFTGDGLATGRRLRWGGVLFGLACAIKIWAFVPLLVVAVLCGRGRWRRYVGAAAAAFVVISAPFAAAAPAAFVREVFVDQLVRGSTQRANASVRIVHLFAVAPPNGEMPGHPALLVAVGLLVAAVLAVLAAQLLRHRAPLPRFAAAATVLVIAMFFVPSDFFWHYAAFAAPFLGLVIALSVPRLTVVGSLLAVVGLVALTWTTVHRDARPYRLHDDAQQVAAVVPVGACVVTEMTSATIADDRFFADDPHCPALIDSFGTALVYGHGRTDAGLRSAGLRTLWRHAYQHADFVYLVHRATPTVPDLPYLYAHFRVVDVPGLHGTLYARVSG
jgi:alpha-1,2-mannosyltransferase